MLISMTFAHKKSLGQNFLNNPHVPRRMCEAGEVGVGDTVLEIGPGTGALTRELLALGAIVKAVEADARAIAALEETFKSELATGQLTLTHGDMRKLSAKDVAQTFGLRDHEYKLIANIPYYLSGLLFRAFLETPVQPSTLVFLTQKEVAERIARSDNSSILSLAVTAYGTPSYICTVRRGNFTPPPRVDSAIISVTNINRDHFHTINERAFFELLHHAFGQKRKQLFGTLRTHYDRGAVASALTATGISFTARPEELSLNEWIAVATILLSPPVSPIS